MTDLLSREKEFLKLNERLEKLATTVLEQQQQQQQHQQQSTKTATRVSNVGGARPPAPASSTAKADQRFYTYTKTHGPSVLLKKRGAGDGSPLVPTAEKSEKPERSTAIPMVRERAATLPATGRTGDITSRFVRQTKIKSPVNGRRESDDSSAPPAEGRNRDSNSMASSNANSYRKNMRPQNSSSRSIGRVSSTRTPRSPTFTIKYRNPKFVQSPSLEVLVKEEGATLRSYMSDLTKLGEAESVASTLNSISKKHISTDGIIKFLKSKIAILEEDHDRISHEMNEQKELLEKAIERQKKVEQQRDQAYSKNNILSEQLDKVETQLDEANLRVKERLLEQINTQKELEKVKRELKLLTQTNNNLDKRLYRANEDLENAKTALTLVKSMERDLKETMRIECESKDNQIKSLKKQRADLLNAYKKQLFLIDNLKRQNTCMEQSKMIGFSEKEFTKILEWNAKT